MLRRRGKLTTIALLTMSCCALPALGGLVAYAVPNGASNSGWTDNSSGWAGPLNISGPLLPPYLVFQTVQTGSGLQWQAWGALDPNLPPGSQQTTALAGRILSSPLAAGQTFRFGFASFAGDFSLGTISPQNADSAHWDLYADFAGSSDYTYVDASGTQTHTGIPNGTPVDVRFDLLDGAGDYSGLITAIANSNQSFSWSGSINDASGINGFLVSNQGSSSQNLGVNYIEVGSGTLPDPATLVPEPSSMSLLVLAAAGFLQRRRTVLPIPHIDGIGRSWKTEIDVRLTEEPTA